MTNRIKRRLEVLEQSIDSAASNEAGRCPQCGHVHPRDTERQTYEELCQLPDEQLREVYEVALAAPCRFDLPCPGCGWTRPTLTAEGLAGLDDSAMCDRLSGGEYRVDWPTMATLPYGTLLRTYRQMASQGAR